ncbi:MAG: FecR domain-containing protein [Gemmatimonadota bacterium]|nr:FecR domain-containing protein [Gemmatimonadota bacterium]
MPNSAEGPSRIAPEDWDRIARYVAGEAEGREPESTRRWLESDAERLTMVNALQAALLNVSREETRKPDVESALRKIKSGFDRTKSISLSPARGRGDTGWTFTRYLKVAAVLLVLAGGAFFWRDVRGTAGPAVRTFATTVGERRQFRLADGTGVVLGPDSRLTVDPRSSDRSVSLHGAGYFAVAHDASHPFTVRVGTVKIQDVGTAFSIQTDETGGIRVAVASGSVALGPRESGRVSAEVLRARDRATVNPSGMVGIERSAVSDDDLAWVQGRLVFHDTPVIQVGTELYRWYGVRLRLADSTLSNLHLTAYFSGESVDRVLNVIALSLGARIEREGNVATLYQASASGIRR